MSKQLSEPQKERFRILLVKAVDGEISSTEEKEFTEFIKMYSDCRQEWQQHKKIKEVTKTMIFKSPPDEIWDSYWQGVYNRIERRLGWIFFSIGSIILIAYGAYEAVLTLLNDASLAWWLKTAILLTLSGLAVILVSVVREKIYTYKSDPYKEITR